MTNTSRFEQIPVFIKAIFLALATFLAYAVCLAADFKTDDRYSIVLNEAIRSFKHLPYIFQTGYFGDGTFYRPLVYVSYMADWFFWADSVFFYHLHNIFSHIFNAFLIWLIVDRMLPERKIGFGVALLFGIHPMHWEAVANLSGRSVMDSTFFSLLCLYAWIRMFEGKTVSPKWMVVSLGSFVTALLYKESAGVMPLVLLVYTRCFLSDRVSWTSLVMRLLPFGGVVILYMGLRWMLKLTALIPWPDVFSGILGFLSFLKSVVTHLALMVWPMGLYFDRSQAVYTSFENVELLCVTGFWVLMLVFHIDLRRHLKPIDQLCLLWMIISLAPVAQVVTAIGVAPGYISTADHFMYMPSIPLCILLVRLVRRFKTISIFKTTINEAALRMIMAAFLCFLFGMTIRQNLYSINELSMIEYSLKRQPNNLRLRQLAGYLAVQNQDYYEAEKHFEWAVKLNPFDASSRISLGAALCHQGRIGECLMQYMMVVDPGPYADMLASNIEYPVYVLQEKASNGRKMSLMDWVGWGRYLSLAQRIDESIPAFETALSLNDAYAPAWGWLAADYERRGDVMKARDAYLRLMHLTQPGNSLFKESMDRLAGLRQKYPDMFMNAL